MKLWVQESVVASVLIGLSGPHTACAQADLEADTLTEFKVLNNAAPTNIESRLKAGLLQSEKLGPQSPK